MWFENLKPSDFKTLPCPNCESDDYDYIYYDKRLGKAIGCDQCIEWLNDEEYWNLIYGD